MLALGSARRCISTHAVLSARIAILTRLRAPPGSAIGLARFVARDNAVTTARRAVAVCAGIRAIRTTVIAPVAGSDRRVRTHDVALTWTTDQEVLGARITVIAGRGTWFRRACRVAKFWCIDRSITTAFGAVRIVAVRAALGA